MLVELADPRARFSRSENRGTLFSCIGETLWYISGSNEIEHIEYYIKSYRKFIKAGKDDVVAPGAYGPRLFSRGDEGQLKRIVRMIKEKGSDTRQAVVQIFSESDLHLPNNDVPCTTTIQLLPRVGQLHMIVTMRSNDLYRGFPADVFAFTFIQELIACDLGLILGSYRHFVGSLHLYDENEGAAHRYLTEGFQAPISMPPMPDGDPWAAIEWLLGVERAIRTGAPEASEAGIHPYWQDLARLLRIKKLLEARKMREIAQQKALMVSSVYDTFLRGREAAMRRSVEQMMLPGV